MTSSPPRSLIDRPLGDLTDAEIAQLTLSIKSEEASHRPLLSQVEPLERLLEEYQPGTLYRKKVERLVEDGWTGLRRSRGDGDCFYRAFIFSLLSTYLSKPSQSSAHLLTTFESLLPLLTACGFEELVWSDFWEPLRDLLRRMGPETSQGGARKDGEKRLESGELLEAFNDQETNSCIIAFIRLLTSSYLRTHSDEFAPFLFALEDDPRFLSPDGAPPTMSDFCQNHVEAISKEADHLQIVALTKALSIPLRIAYLDQSGTFGQGYDEGDETRVNFVEFEEDRAKEEGVVELEGALLYRPGHYDLIYR